VNRIANEDFEESTAREAKKKESVEMLQKFKVEAAERQEAAEQAEEDEAAAIEKYAQDKREREERVAAEKEAAAKEKERKYMKIVKAAEHASKEKEEFELLRNELHAEEGEAEQRRREELKQRKVLEDREEMKRASMLQMQMQEDKKAQALVEEDRIRVVLLAKFAEDDRLEQMMEHKRRMKVEAHKREVQRLIELRREAFDQARDAERDYENDMRADEGDRQKIINEERQKLLIEHAVPLRNFLPKGTLDNMDDFEFVFNHPSIPAHKRGYA